MRYLLYRLIRLSEVAVAWVRYKQMNCYLGGDPLTLLRPNYDRGVACVS
jgi:hypothetical protein